MANSARRKKRSSTRLPRLTVLAWSKRDLALFADAVERLRHITGDLADLVNQLRMKLPRKPRPKPAEDPEANGQQAAQDILNAK